MVVEQGRIFVLSDDVACSPDHLDFGVIQRAVVHMRHDSVLTLDCSHWRIHPSAVPCELSHGLLEAFNIKPLPEMSVNEVLDKVDAPLQ
jgi:hypothetical protein